MESLGNLSLLLSLIIFIFALIGMQFIGGHFTPGRGFEEVP